MLAHIITGFIIDVVVFHLYMKQGDHDIKCHNEGSAHNVVVNALAQDYKELKIYHHGVSLSYPTVTITSIYP